MKTLQSFVDASMLGDGALRLRTNNSEKNPKYQLSQIALHTDYVEWIEKELSSFGLVVKKYFIPSNTRTTIENVVINAKDSWRLETWNNSQLLPLYYRWYGYGKKQVPADITLDWQALAMWIMDDGSLARNAYQIYSMSFSELENYVLTNALSRDLNISATVINHHGKKIINIPTRYTEIIINNTQPYITPSFTYKFKALDKSRKYGER